MGFTKLRASCSCRNALFIVSLTACLADFIGNGIASHHLYTYELLKPLVIALAIFRIFTIWDKNKKVLYSLIAGATIAFACSVTLAAVIVDHINYGEYVWKLTVPAT